MQGLFARPSERFDESDLRDLVEVRKVREHDQLDYKQESYSHNHDGAVEMLADVTAMANARGGYLLIGVEEDKAEPDGTPKALVGIRDGDAEARWIQSLCISSIDERIPSLQVRGIPLASGLSCVVVEIPNSVRKPHMVVHEKHRSFRMRHGRDKSLMGMQEVRNMILAMNSYRLSLSRFLDERKLALEEVAQGKPWFLLGATPIYVDSDKLDPLRPEIRSILEQAPGNPDPRSFPDGIRAGVPQPRVFGIEAKAELGGIDTRYMRFLRLFRNGHFECCSDTIRRGVPNDFPATPMTIYAYEMAVLVLHFLEVAKRVMAAAEINEPIALTLRLQNCSPSVLRYWNYDHEQHFILSSGQAIVWGDQSLSLDLSDTDLMGPETLVRALMDRLFAAFGSEPVHNTYFDAEGHFVRHS